jgi:hypothetical protein
MVLAVPVLQHSTDCSILDWFAVRRQNLLDRSGSSIREYPVHQLS